MAVSILSLLGQAREERWPGLVAQLVEAGSLGQEDQQVGRPGSSWSP